MHAEPGESGKSEGQGFLSTLTRGAAGVGFVLVALPAALLFFGMPQLAQVRLVGLPLLAIFGIMILFGSLALVAMLFQSLDLSDPAQPLALPEGSIRAAIALSLIVLFAIISIMLFQGMEGKTFEVDGLTLAQRNEIVVQSGTRIEKVTQSCTSTPQPGAACPEADRRFSVMLRSPPGSESNDLAKQLLVLVGTLMTSVTSYYFAARSLTSGGRKTEPDRDASNNAAASAGAANLAASAEDHLDGCDVAIAEPTRDEELPPARGGVEPSGA